MLQAVPSLSGIFPRITKQAGYVFFFTLKHLIILLSPSILSGYAKAPLLPVTPVWVVPEPLVATLEWEELAEARAAENKGWNLGI